MRPLSILTFVILSGAAVPASAGLKTARPLQIGMDFAAGSLTSVRGSSNQVDQILCKLGNDRRIECTAADASTSVTCWSTNPVFFPAVQMINKASHLMFTWDLSTMECLQISVDNNSRYLP